MIHHVYANRSNLGDLLAAHGIQKLLAPAPVVEHLCDEPFVADTLEALAGLASSDLVVIGGGGLLMDYFEGFWRGFLELRPTPRYCLWGVGVCDIKREPSLGDRDLLRLIVKRSEYCVLRDAHSAACADAKCDEIVQCPSLSVVAPRPITDRCLLHVDNYTTAGADVFDVMDAQASVFAEATGRKYRRTNNRLDPRNTAERILDLYRQADVVLSSALHGCVIAVAMGRPVLAVSGDHKIEAFMAAAGLEDWVCSQSEVALTGQRLSTLPQQPSAAPFVRRTNAANLQVAERIRSLHAQSRDP